MFLQTNSQFLRSILAGKFVYLLPLHALFYLFLRHVVSGNFKVPLALTVKKRIVRFEGLPEFKWSDLGEQDVVGQGLFIAVFRTKYA